MLQHRKFSPADSKREVFALAICGGGMDFAGIRPRAFEDVAERWGAFSP